MLSFNIAAG